MIKKLRIKFIATAMISVALVLVAIMGTVNILNYNSIVQEADDTLMLLQMNDGKFPMKDSRPLQQITDETMLEEVPLDEIPLEEAQPDGVQPDGAQPDGAQLEGQGGFDGKGFMDGMSAETPYETRFFWVETGEDGQVSSYDTSSIAAIDDEAAENLALKVIASGKTAGFEGNYRYLVQQTETGQKVIFLDCTRNLMTCRTFLLASLAISLVGLVAVFALIVLLSGYIVKPISQSYEKQRRFVTDAGHEIKTPLTIIDADAEILQMDMEQNEWVEDIRRQTKRLASLTNDLIYLSRMDEGQDNMKVIDFPLSDVVGEIAQSFQAPARTQGKSLDIDLTPMISLEGDEKAIRQLISILMDNAFKYSPKGGEVKVSLKEQGKWITLSVANTVENVIDENTENFFDRFYRGDKSRNSETGGFGIGLSVAKAVVTAHKGKISASYDEESHIVIRVSLPK